MMNEIFRLEIDKGQVIIYLDDILIFSKTKKEHHAQIRRVLQILRENKLYLKLEKCSFDQEETEYLGLIIGHGQIKMDPIKTKGIADWPIPQKKRDVQSFLGFCNFYRRFIQGYSRIAHPLTSLTGNSPWHWDDEQQQSFEKIKTLIATAPILSIPTDDDPFRIETDASEFAIRAVLSQKQNDKWKPITFIVTKVT